MYLKDIGINTRHWVSFVPKIGWLPYIYKEFSVVYRNILHYRETLAAVDVETEKRMKLNVISSCGAL